MWGNLFPIIPSTVDQGGALCALSRTLIIAVKNPALKKLARNDRPAVYENLANLEKVPVKRFLVPESRQLFGPLSVKENLLMGAFSRYKHIRKKEIYRDLETVYSMFPILGSRCEQSASTLSGGEQQMLAHWYSLDVKASPAFVG